jgi:hypothetical protein
MQGAIVWWVNLTSHPPCRKFCTEAAGNLPNGNLLDRSSFKKVERGELCWSVEFEYRSCAKY